MATKKKEGGLQKKHIVIFSIFALLLLILVFSIRPIMNHFAKNEVATITEVLNSENEHKNIDQCRVILNFDKTTVKKNNKYFDEKKFDEIAFQCDEDYNLEHVEIDRDNCAFIIRETQSYFNRNYIIISSLDAKRLECSKKFLNPTFSNWTFFNINNDFKSQVVIDFELDFFRDAWEIDSDEYIQNRVDAKKRLVGLFQIAPEIEVNINDIYLYPRKAILNLNLEPLTEYTVSLLPYETDMWEPTNHKEFKFKTPENKYFGMKVKDPLSIYTKDNLPEFQIIDYNTEKTNTQISLCHISPESYAEVEVYMKTGDKESAREYFKSWMQWVELSDCITKDFDYKSEEAKNKNEFVRKDFNFKEFVEDENPAGLYILYFPWEEDREYNWKINKPILFGVANSHIMMKVSRNGEWFFFINDFNGKPLANQSVNVYINDFQEVETNWNEQKRDYDHKYNLPLWDNKVFSWAINLGRTWEDWVLRVDFNDRINDYFYRTFAQEWDYNWSGLYKSFFIESAGNGYNSFLTSTWNAGIEPWNFGYTTDWSSDENQLQLYPWGELRTYNAHIYTDRRLYLPWEEVNIKTIVRNATDLSIPEWTEFKLTVNDSKWEEVLSKTFKVNEYGSHSETLKLNQDIPLWDYSIALWQWDNSFFYTWFNVEVFKNPKFSNEVVLNVSGLNNELVNITSTEKENYDYWYQDVYKWSFKIKWSVNSKYYNWWVVKNADFTYKVYKQYYYPNNYWDNCYYWCYWEPRKEFYTEWKWKIDENWVGTFEVDVDFASSYNDYKYIVEVTVTDEAWDTITGSNSVIAKLPSEYKRWNRDLDIYFDTENKFVAVGDKITLRWGLNVWDWTKEYNNKYVFVIKRKEYEQDRVIDANGYPRTIQKVNEIVERVMYINYENFKLTWDGKLELNYKLDENSEYVFEYWAVDNFWVNRYLWLAEDKVASDKDIEKIIKDFDENKALYLENEVVEKVTILDECERTNWAKWCSKEEEQTVTRKLNLRDFVLWDKYLSVITYNDSVAKNPIENDNKLRVLTEKVSYNIWDKARVLVRLPVSKSKILWTVEKNWVVEHEYIDVEWNIFFKEFLVDESYAPNSYIGVMMVDTTTPYMDEKTWLNILPQYKVGYAEVVIDKTDKKSFVSIKADKDKYKPREEVTLDLEVTDKAWKAIPSELTVMVVDDSLISLMWNVDLNTLEKMFIKLPFNIQTSLTNIAMLKNYYFSRYWIVGWSWYGDMKWWDSAVSTRNIFKNTAYFNPTVITDASWKAQVKFTLPDNLTNFRVMVVSNSKDNHFGYSEDYLNVRKNVIVEDKTPLILRDWDNSVIGANIFNNTNRDQDFKVSITAQGASIPVKEQSINIKAWSNTFVSWAITAKAPAKEIDYTITALWNSLENSDSIANKIMIEEDPTLIRNIIKVWTVLWNTTLNLESDIPTNTNFENSKVEITVSNSRLAWIEKILKTLIKYPYWCIEQITSMTLPNVIVKNFESMFAWMFDMAEINKNITDWVEKILAMQNADWGFVYWPWNSSSDLYITPYVVRSLVYMKESGVEIPQEAIDKAIWYLESNLERQLDDTQKSEIYWTLASAWKAANVQIDTKNLDRHSLIAYTYWLVKVNWNKTTIRNNIERIKGLLVSDNKQSWYWDNISDKAIFASLLIENNDKNDDAYIEELITDLYAKDWDSYYYSTQSKNNAFMAFHSYLVKTWVDNHSAFSFKLWSYNDNKTYRLWAGEPNLLKFEFSLASVKLADKLVLSVNNMSENNLYVDYVIKQYPEDKLKVEPYSNWMQVKKEVFEVLDESLLSKCSDDYWYDQNKVECSKVLWKAKTDYIYEKAKLYKAKITVNFDSEAWRRLLTIEDYLPWTFRVINSNFRTESSAITEASKNWNWSYKEFRPWVVMANAQYVWWKDIVFEYYFRPEFSGKYTEPPVTWYMMYDPLIRASGRFVEVEVK